MSDIGQKLFRSSGRRGWNFAPFGSSGSVRISKGRDEVVIHMAKDGRMRSAFINNKRVTGGLKRILEFIEEGK